MIRSDCIDRSTFKLLKSSRPWTFAAPLSDFYKQQKGRELFSSPAAHGAANPEAESTFATHAMKKLSNAAMLRRWQMIFAPRIQRALTRTPSTVQPVFPETASVWDSLVNGTCGGLPAGPRLGQLAKLLSLPANIPAENPSAMSNSAPSPWHWRHLTHSEHPRSIFIASPTHRSPDEKLRLVHFAASKIRDKAEFAIDDIICLFRAIHQSWDEDCEPSYVQHILSTATEILNEIRAIEGAVEALIPVLFELEMFASYESLLQRIEVIGSGIFAGLWIDVGSMPLYCLRGTESCEPNRLFDELINLAQGRTAPILVNEYGCVADGNHRLTAAWIWNILNSCNRHDWSLQDDSFQRAVCQFVERSATDVTTVSLHEALRCLGTLLLNNEQRRTINHNLRGQICRQDITALPVIPILEYCSFAAVASNYDRNKELVRFRPSTYKFLQITPGAMLPHRACYHFADTKPLPWFSLAGTGTIRPSRHVIYPLRFRRAPRSAKVLPIQG